MGQGKVLLIPAGIPHYYKVLQAPFEFLCILPNATGQIRIVATEQSPSCQPDSSGASVSGGSAQDAPE